MMVIHILIVMIMGAVMIQREKVRLLEVEKDHVLNMGVLDLNLGMHVNVMIYALNMIIAVMIMRKFVVAKMVVAQQKIVPME